MFPNRSQMTDSALTNTPPPSPEPSPKPGPEPYDTSPDSRCLSGLNVPQREAVLTTEGPVLVLAGAGTGKTAALTARLAYLITTKRAWPSQILAVTFTNKAAQEMKARVGPMIDMAESLPWLGTFHAIGAKILRRHAELVGLQSNFTILDRDDQLRLLKQLIQSEGLDEKLWPPRFLASLIDKWKNRGLSPKDIDDSENKAIIDGKGCQLYALYQTRLKALNACDFGDLLLHMLVILKTHHDVLEQYQDRFKYILVDEYQDTNTSQYLWLRLLAQKRKNICCVGDDDQSIYGWRGAEITNILRFERDFPGAVIIRLEKNYRSTPHILAVASGLIANNDKRLGKKLWTELDKGDKIGITAVWDGPEEARRIGEKLEDLQNRNIKLNDAAILVRAQFQTREFEDRFIAIAMPYRIIGGFRFYERSEIRDMLAYLRLVHSLSDDLAFERIVNIPKRGLDNKSLAQIRMFARVQQLSLTQAAARIVESDGLTPQAQRSLAGFIANVGKWREKATQLSHSELMRLIIDESGYSAMLRADQSLESVGRQENLSELLRTMEDYENLESFLDHVSLVMDRETNQKSEKVTIMTMHAAKGLEFDHVFLVGWEEGIFPSQRALNEGGAASLEEERRLAYVAITRARRRCTIWHAANRRIHGQRMSRIPSRFITELPVEHLEYDNTMDSRNTRGGSNTRGGNLWSTHWRSQVQARPRSSFAIGMRVFHKKFGYGTIGAISADKLEVKFERVGSKHVLDSFVRSE